MCMLFFYECKGLTFSPKKSKSDKIERNRELGINKRDHVVCCIREFKFVQRQKELINFYQFRFEIIHLFNLISKLYISNF